MYPFAKHQKYACSWDWYDRSFDRVEVDTSVQRRQRWSAGENAAIVPETDALAMSVSLVAQQRSVALHQVFNPFSGY